MVFYNGSAYNTWFRGVNGSGYVAIGYASSRDGVNWQVLGYPVLPATPAWVGAIGGPFKPSVIWNGTRYLMYYTSQSSPPEKDIGLAVSTDMIHWTEYPNNPIFRPGPGAYDSEWVAYPSVVYDPPLYKMWYTGQSMQTKTETVGYATSLDGVHWNKPGGNPVLTSQSTKTSSYNEVRYPSVIKVGSGYLMAFYAYLPGDGDILYASSNDGLNWTVGSSPLLLTGGNTSTWDYHVSAPALVYSGSGVLLFYSGGSGYYSNLSSPYYTSIGVAPCHFVFISEIQTVASSSTIIQTATITETTSLTKTSTVTSSIITQVYSSEFEALSAVLAAGLVGAGWLLVRRRGPGQQPSRVLGIDLEWSETDS